MVFCLLIPARERDHVDLDEMFNVLCVYVISQ